ncbi:pseudouridine synthase [Paenibacillus curdlanolyticus YK9]|uniref:Pseudouridine synthase n=1 Tax=Paenibacillus curdlanolyticus YK9 TaxID=717606 RepID=E0ICD0_9BACL|nr:pseudouridine synthase [Paenibacillus curdlanolyticus YK9]
MKKLERLQKILAQAGIASRRKCEELIISGQVEVNGVPVTTLGAKADPEEDVITVGGKPIVSENKLYIMLNKPKGVITSASDPQGRKVVSDFLTGIKQRVYPIGRLDYDTEGLLLLTNDGEFANLLTHPKHHVPKTYWATVKGVPHGDKLDKLRKGIELEDGMTSPAEVEYQDIEPSDKESTIRITIYEGRNRQVRRMFDAIGHPVIRLKRVKFGELGLQNLKRGGWRPLKPHEVQELLQEAAKAEGKSSYVPSGKPATKPEWKPKPKPKHLTASGDKNHSNGQKEGGSETGRKPFRSKQASNAAATTGSRKGKRSRQSYAESVLGAAAATQGKGKPSAGVSSSTRAGSRSAGKGPAKGPSASAGKTGTGAGARVNDRSTGRGSERSVGASRSGESAAGRNAGRNTGRSSERPAGRGASRSSEWTTERPSGRPSTSGGRRSHKIHK